MSNGPAFGLGCMVGYCAGVAFMCGAIKFTKSIREEAWNAGVKAGQEARDPFYDILMQSTSNKQPAATDDEKGAEP